MDQALLSLINQILLKIPEIPADLRIGYKGGMWK